MDTFLFVFSDCVMLPLLELLILVILVCAIYKDINAYLRRGGTHATVTRGEKSWLSLVSFWGMSVTVVNIINSSELVGNYKVVLSLLNLVFIIYLNFFNSYFRNKIIGWTIKAQQFEEKV
jgi:uncharacterized membrane protein YobD (UPF0266 family)